MTRDELISSKEYWITKIQLNLFNEIHNFLEENNWTNAKLAKELNVTKSYVSQILNGDFDHKISKLVDLALVIGKAPVLNFVDLEKVDIQFKPVNKNPLIYINFSGHCQVSFNHDKTTDVKEIKPAVNKNSDKENHKKGNYCVQ